MNKKTYLVSKAFDMNNRSIQIFEDVFLRYSKKKMYLALEDPNVS